MRDDEFETRLIEWLDMPGEGDPYPYYADPYPADPRDARFDALCALYLEADEAQRAQIPALFAREQSTRLRAHRRLDRLAPARQERPLQPDPLHAPRGLLDQVGR